MIKNYKSFYYLLFFIGLLSCDKKDYLFEKIASSDSGVNFSNDLNDQSSLNIFNYLYYYNGAGVAAADYNNDGLIDLFFTSNEGNNQLYLNNGDFKFSEMKISSFNSPGWTTGVSNIDINNDGLMDIYICKVSGLDERAHNQLLVNQGTDESGNIIFKDAAKEYNLDFSGYSTQAAFLDYDLDGDLDMYLLNHSTHPNRNYGRGSKRDQFDSISGDRFFENKNGIFEDISEKVGIHQGVIGYGLGVAVGDLNNDGYPDVYIGNDFFENDYVYINQQDGTFRDINSSEENFGHTSHFSMGNDIADVNNDGFQDVFSLDMLPQDLETYKTSGLEYPYQTYSNYLKNGFSPQYMQNTLHLNNAGAGFSETAYLSGVAATDWSWGALFADFDNDSNLDLYITNGIIGATNDMDYIRFISNDKIQKQLSSGENANFEELIKELPEKKVANSIFQNMGDNRFEDRNGDWIDSQPSFSNGFVYADLDNDGDLDLIVNNTNENAFLYRNNSDKLKEKSNYLDIVLKGSDSNRFGIGAKVILYSNGKIQAREHWLTRGYLSSLAPGLHFGLGKTTKIDSVKVFWPDSLTEIKTSVSANDQLIFDHKNAKRSVSGRSKEEQFLTLLDSVINFDHEDQSTLEFNREILVPFASTNLGPRSAVADIDGNGLDDIILGGAKTKPSELFYQFPDGFQKSTTTVFEEDAISEDIDQVIFDANNDGLKDILIVSGGNEFKQGRALQPRLYLNSENGFELSTDAFDIELNASSVKVIDFNKDGFLDVCITSNIKPTQFGIIPRQFILLNNGNGKFIDKTSLISTDFKDQGMVQDQQWVDLNNDGYLDVITVGHWMPITVFINRKGEKLEKQDTGLNATNGWWNCLKVADFDNDGDMDIVAGNWGLNSRLQASAKEPMKLYLNDFDENGTNDPVITYFFNGKETAFASKDELDKQMPFLKKQFTNYKSYASAEFSYILPKEKVRSSKIRKVFELGSCYFENDGSNHFEMKRLPFEAQVSSVFDIENFDFNRDGFQDLFLVGNNYEISTQLGRLDALHGLILINDQNGSFKKSNNKSPVLNGAARNIQKININGTTHFIVTFNNDRAVVLKTNFSDK